MDNSKVGYKTTGNSKQEPLLLSTYFKLMYNGMCGGFPRPHKGINFQHNLHKVVDPKDFINKVTKPC